MGSHAIIGLVGPFDLALSLEAAASFLPPTGTRSQSLRLAVRSAGQPAIIEIRQPSRAPPVIEVSVTVPVSRSRLKKKALWLASGDLDLRRFYRFGTWSVEYFLLRGLGRFDSLAADDIGLRRTIGLPDAVASPESAAA